MPKLFCIGKVPVADYRLATQVPDKERGSVQGSGETDRSCYSFCMCPVGQIGRCMCVCVYASAVSLTLTYTHSLALPLLSYGCVYLSI